MAAKDSGKNEPGGVDENGIKTTLRKFGENTSIKGIPRVFKAGHISVRLLWGIAVATGIGFGTFLIVQLVSQYIKYGVHTTYKECLTCAPTFPDVTVCNLNPSFQLPENPMNVFFNYVLGVNAMLTPDQLNALMGFEMSVADRDKFLGEFISLAGYYQNTLLENITAVLQNDVWRQLVVDCSWHGWNWNKHPKHNCMRTSLYRVLSPEYQWCITFHTNRSIEPGNDIRGLMAIFYLDDFSDTHIPKFLSDLRHAQAEGMRVVIHEPGSLPDLKLGFNIPPGHDSIVKLTGIDRVRLPHPYSNCTDQQDLEEATGTTNTELDAVHYQYSYDGCINLCQQRYVMEHCGCLSAHIAFSPTLPQSGLPFCAQVDGSEDMGAEFGRTMKAAHCAMTVNTSAILCDCQVPCHDLQYQHTLLATKWPHPNYQLAFYDQYIQNQPYKEKFSYYSGLLGPNVTTEHQKAALQGSDLMSRNFLQLNIHFPRASTWQHEDQPQVTADSLLGVLGGLLNLWMGVTFITIVELLELCLNIMQNSMQHRSSSHNTTRIRSLSAASDKKHQAWNKRMDNRLPPVQS